LYTQGKLREFIPKFHMNKNILLITVALALSLSGVGCNKSGKLDKGSTFKATSGPVELKLKWPVGQRVVQSFDMKQSAEISIPARSHEAGHDHGAGIWAYGVKGKP
jgi:hypothetical protein